MHGNQYVFGYKTLNFVEKQYKYSYQHNLLINNPEDRTTFQILRTDNPLEENCHMHGNYYDISSMDIKH